MKKRRYFPKTLLGRVTLLLVSLALLTQLIAITVFQMGQPMIYSTSSSKIAFERIIAIVNQLNELPASDRQFLIDMVENPLVRVQLYDADTPPPYWPESGFDLEEQNKLTQLGYRFLEKEIIKKGNVNYPAYFYIDDFTLPQIVQRERAQQEYFLSTIPLHVQEKFSKIPNAQALKYRLLFATFQLQDGAWVEFSHYASLSTLQARNIAITMISSVIILLLLLSIIISRWMIKPLNYLAETAEAIGRDINAPEIPVTGPIEVRRTTTAFNKMKRQLTHFVQDRSRMLAAISHDLKTPLTRLQLYVDQIKPTTKEEMQIKEKFVKELHALQSMTLSTLELLRGQEDTEKTQHIDMMSLLETLKEELKESKYDFIIIGKTNSAYLGKFISLKRCLSNLLENAVYYGRDVKVMLNDTPDQLVINISNLPTQQIDSTELKKAFAPFYRLKESTQQRPEGSGLGLSIAQNIAHAHGGELSLKLEDDRVVATLVLPR